MLRIGRFLLKDTQEIVLAGCFNCDVEDGAIVIKAGDHSFCDIATQYKTNCEEVDSRIWKHALECPSGNILIYSPDILCTILDCIKPHRNNL